MATDKKKSTKAKAPQDRKPKKEKKIRPEDTPGFNLLRPMGEVPVWDQTPLLALIYKLQDLAGDNDEIEMDETEAIVVIGQIAKALVPIANDEKEFTKFATGPEAFNRVADLAMAWASAVGEAKSSADS